MTRSRLIAGVGSLIGFAGFFAANLHWPQAIAPWGYIIALSGLSIGLYGARGVRQALKDRQIDTALKDHSDV